MLATADQAENALSISEMRHGENVGRLEIATLVPGAPPSASKPPIPFAMKLYVTVPPGSGVR